MLYAEIVIKTTLLLCLAVMAGSLAKRYGPAMRHMVWLVVFLGTILLLAVNPFLRGATVLPLPAEVPTFAGNDAPAPGAPTLDGKDVAPANPILMPAANEQTRLPWETLLILLWASGFLVIAVRYAHGVAALRVLRNRTEPVNEDSLRVDPRDLARRAGITSNWELRMATASDPASAMTWGFRRPVVLLPNEADSWPPERLEAVLLHEFAHVRRNDFASQLLAEFACALNWFNPIAWYGARAMRADAELAADEAVLRSGVRPSAYAAMLLQIAVEIGRQRQPLLRAGIPIMSQPNIESRLHSVLSPTARRRGVTTLQALAATLVASLAVSGMASLSAEPQSGQSVRPKDEQTLALSRMKQAALATIMYSQDFDDVLPYSRDTATAVHALQPYTRSQEIFESPTQGGQFRYNLNVAGCTVKSLKAPSETPLWYEVLPNNEDPTVAYVDGHAKVIHQEDRKAFAEALKKKYPRPSYSKPFTAPGIDKSG